MAITSSTARADIFKEFYSVVKNNLSTTGVKITNAFVEDVAQLPQIVIKAPSLPKRHTRFGTNALSYDRDGEIELEVYARTMQELVELVDDLENTIFSNLASLSISNLSLGESNDGTFELSGKSVRVMLLPFSFQFRR